jgi:hypothetical protein
MAEGESGKFHAGVSPSRLGDRVVYVFFAFPCHSALIEACPPIVEVYKSYEKARLALGNWESFMNSEFDCESTRYFSETGNA